MKIHSLGCQVKDGLVVGGFDEKGREVYIVMFDRPADKVLLKVHKTKITCLKDILARQLYRFLKTFGRADGPGLNKRQLKGLRKDVKPIIDRLISS